MSIPMPMPCLCHAYKGGYDCGHRDTCSMKMRMDAIRSTGDSTGMHHEQKVRSRKAALKFAEALTVPVLSLIWCGAYLFNYVRRNILMRTEYGRTRLRLV